MPRADDSPEPKGAPQAGAVETALLLLHSTRKAHDGRSMRSHWDFTRTLLTQMWWLPTFRRWRSIGTNPALAAAFQHRPSIAAAVVGPYLNTRWSARERMAMIQGHYARLSGRLDFLHIRPLSVRLAEYVFAPKTGLSPLTVVLDEPPWLAREGELALSLFIQGNRVYSLAFTLGERDDIEAAYIGGLQGLSHPGARDLYRDLTRSLHGLRPRDLLLAMFRSLCSELDVLSILAVDGSASVCHHERFSERHKVVASYDDIWLEHNGVRMPDGFFDLAAGTPRRVEADVPARKRALYRRRYQMLDTMQWQLQRTVSDLRQHADLPGRSSRLAPAERR